MLDEILKGAILITGGCGFLGQNLANELILSGYRAVLFDIKQDRSLLADHVNEGNCAIISGDVVNISELMEALLSQKADSIIHAALDRGAHGRPLRPYQSIKANLLGTCHALEAARLLNIGRVTFVSTGAVYDPQLKRCAEDAPFSVDMSRGVLGLYASLKVSGEMIGLKYAQIYGVDFAVARCPGIYGPGVIANHTLNILLRNACQGKKTEFKTGGDHRFEFLHVKDAARGIRRIHTAHQLKHRIYNVGTGYSHSLFEVAEKIKKHIPTADISLGPGLLNEDYWVQRGPMDIARIKELGYRPEYDLDRGISEFIHSFQVGQANPV